ncbi:MAG TPA: undecaprenyl-diphosphatase UppP [Patescibacteria group bacterium]
MNSGIFQSFVLGIIQGLGEFLPISSTAHLAIVPYFFHWKDPGLSFDVALHIGTLIAVVAYFWKEWIMIFELAFKKQVQNSKFKVQSYGKNTLWLIVIATVPGVLAGYFLEKDAETIFRNPLLIAFALAFAGLILYLADKYAKQGEGMEGINLKKALVVGLSQAVAIVPGVSRSGATITAGLFTGLDRKSAARFSFLLSTPIIFGAVALKLPYLWQRGLNPSMIIGILSSTVSGYLAIKYLIKFLENYSYKIFFWYRIFLAVAIILFIVSK